MNTDIVTFFMGHPYHFLLNFIAKPLAGAVIAYGLVWLFMRPKDGRTVPNPFLWWLALGVAVAVAGGAMFRIVAMVTFAGHSAYEPASETGAAGFYILIVPAIAAAGYIAWLRTRMVPMSIAASQTNVSVANRDAPEEASNDAYAAALAEIEEDRLDKGVWARSFAESGGDESKANRSSATDGA